MNDYNKNTSGYEPNFILKPAVPADAETVSSEAADPAKASAPEMTGADTAKAAVPETDHADTMKADATGTDFTDTLKTDAQGMVNAQAASSEGARPAAGSSFSDTAPTPDPVTDSFYSKASQPSGSASSARPRFENPSFDPGRTGNYRDPRDQFHFGESASWSNGEVHRNKKAVKDSIRKQKKAAQPIMLTRKALALLIAGCMCLSCLFGLGGAALGNALTHQNQPATAQTAVASSTDDSTASHAGYTLEEATGSNMTVKEITAAAKNSVVEIRTEQVTSDAWMQQYVTEGAGSGVIISEDGYIMTNNHVINGASKIKVTTADKQEYEAKLIGTDETNDVAVIKVDASGLTPVTYGNSDQLEVGDLAVAIGNPLGELGGTVTAGIISATDRALSIDGKTMHLLQTDSSINPGNSGGGLFSGNGQLIGLVVAKSAGSDVEGLGFAIPVNTAANVAQQLMDKGYVSGQPSSGMTYQEGSSSVSGDSNNPFSSFDSFFGSGSSAKQVYIYSVNGENAKKAGFQSGDLVYAIEGQEITSFDDVSSIITAHKVGDTLTYTIVRDGQKKEIKLQLEEKNASTNNSGSSEQGEQGGQLPDQGDQNGQDGQLPDQGDQDGQLPDQGGQFPGQGGSWQDWFNSLF